MITSYKNPQIKDIRKLLESPKERKEKGLFAAEGEKLFLEAPLERISRVYVSESYLKKPWLPSKLEETGYIEVSDDVFNRMTDTVSPQGILCTVRIPEPSLERLFSGEEEFRRILMLEGIQDPGNLGTILRTAEAAGFNPVIADKNTADVYSPKAIRSTMGAVFRVRMVYVEDIKDAIRAAKDNGTVVYAAHLKGRESFNVTEYAQKTAVLIGNEGRGLSEETSDLADKLIRIPMKGRTESLNASIAAALIMYAAYHE